ncbi:hypothetical protein Godav_021539 [Gossypium davidsonii]|uniref:Uncharacterized protein n=1 Tax=Gossypium davidsonii TaxID=34287 RepID=A0A7J8R6P2_GOSDV|nr:hypothetical protein [Gossypium davidsonii]
MCILWGDTRIHTPCFEGLPWCECCVESGDISKFFILKDCC